MSGRREGTKLYEMYHKVINVTLHTVIMAVNDLFLSYAEYSAGLPLFLGKS